MKLVNSHSKTANNCFTELNMSRIRKNDSEQVIESREDKTLFGYDEFTIIYAVLRGGMGWGKAY